MPDGMPWDFLTWRNTFAPPSLPDRPALAPPSASATTPLHELGVVETATAIAEGAITAEAVTVAALDRLARLGPRSNAIMRTEDTSALAAARAVDVARARGARLGPLAGVALAHKDMFGRAGWKSTGGSAILRDHVAGETAFVLRCLDTAGAIDLGRLHMAEFALSPTGFNAQYGHGRNPWNPEYCPGGSSSGSGAAVAARLVAGALGSDTGGSVRQPAAMCGVVGLKPTQGAISLSGVMKLSPSLDNVGPLARSARDAARLFSAIARPDAQDAATAQTLPQDYEAGLVGDARGLVIAMPQEFYHDDIAPEIAAALAEAARALGEAGARIVTTTVPDIAEINAQMMVLLTSEAAALHRVWLETRPDEYGALVRARITPGFAQPATAYLDALTRRPVLAQNWLDIVLAGADLVLLPILVAPVPRIADTLAETVEALAGIARLTRCTRGINYMGLPALALPCGVDEAGLPIGLQLVGRPWAEALLLRAGDAYQRQTDWHRRAPPEG